MNNSLLSSSKTFNSSNTEKVQQSKHLSEELTFLFYVNLNMKSLRNPKLTVYIIKPVYQELYKIETPKQRLMTILSKDNDLKTWFSERIMI
jgi:hypothetical protein